MYNGGGGGHVTTEVNRMARNQQKMDQQQQQQPPDNYNYEYYYDDPENQTETTINDAAIFFNRRQFESTTVTVTPATSVTGPTATTSAVTKKKKKKRKPGARGPNRRKNLPSRQQAGPGFRQRSPLNPPLKLAFAQIRLPIRRPGLKRRRKNNDQQIKNGTVVNANQTNPAVPGPGKKKKGKKSNNQRNRNRNRNRKNGKNNKKRGTKKPQTPPQVNNSQFEYERPPFMISRNPPAGPSSQATPIPGPSANGTDDEYYYEYYDSPQGNAGGNGQGSGPNNNNNQPPFGNNNNQPQFGNNNNNQPPFGNNNNNNQPQFGNNNNQPPFGINNGNNGNWPPASGMPWGGTPLMGGPGGMSSPMGLENRMPTTVPGGMTRIGGESEAKTFCQSQNFNDASYCCGLPHPTLFDPDDMDECLDDLDPDEEPPAIDEYSVNRGLIGNGVVDFGSPSMKNLSDAICLTHCTMISLEYLDEDPNSLDYDEVRAYMESHLNDNKQTEWIPLLNEVSKTCQKSVTAMNQIQDRIETSDYTCFTKPYLYVQCIEHYMLFKCPTPSDRATSDFCKSSMSSLNQCNPFDDN